MATPPTSAPAAPARNGAPTFEAALRGYDRRQVDEFVAAGRNEVAQLRAELTEARRQQRAATEHAEATERELRELRARPAQPEAPTVEDGFGYRAEKLLRLAEQEASEARTTATRESAAILEQARTEAEQHRHEVEQNLIARSSLLEQQAAQRAAELQEREQQISDQVAAAREQADQVHAAATLAADRLRQQSEAAAAETRQRAEVSVRRQRDQAEQELARLTALQGDVRAELARLAEVLAGELGDRKGGRPRNGRTATVPEQRDQADATAAPGSAGKTAQT
jgi:hypothetical protein